MPARDCLPQHLQGHIVVWARTRAHSKAPSASGSMIPIMILTAEFAKAWIPVGRCRCNWVVVEAWDAWRVRDVLGSIL
jgi:hypothetical protein